MDGQAEMAPNPEDDLVSFLVDNDDADTPQEAPTDGDEPSEELDTSDTDNTEDAPAEDDDEGGDTDDSPDKPATPTSDLKFKVPVKGEDGSESIVEVDQKELIAGYQRHSDYTRKTQETSALKKSLDARSEELDHKAAATEEELEARSAVRFPG